MLNSSALIKLQSVAVWESEDSEVHLQSQHPGVSSWSAWADLWCSRRKASVCAFQGHTTTDSSYLSYAAQQVMASLKVNINVKNVLGGFIHLLNNIILGICIAKYKFLCNKTPYSSKSDEANGETNIYKIFRVTI